MISNKKKLEMWRAILTKTLEVANDKSWGSKPKNEEEFFDQELVYTDKHMVGCYLAIFIKRKLAARIPPKSFQSCKIKAGTAGVTGNKGAVCLRFEIENQPIMIINCHLTSGGSKDIQRTEQLMKIFDQAFQNNLRNRRMTIDFHEHVVLMGDLNYRISGLNRKEVFQKIETKSINDLLDKDALSISRYNYRKDKDQIIIKLKKSNKKNPSQAESEREARMK